MPAPETAPGSVLVHPLYLAGPGSPDVTGQLTGEFGWRKPPGSAAGVLLADRTELVTLAYETGTGPGASRAVFTAQDAYSTSPQWRAVFNDLVPEEILSAFALTMASRLDDRTDNYLERQDPPTAAQQILRNTGWREGQADDTISFQAPDGLAIVRIAAGPDTGRVEIAADAGLPGRTWSVLLEGRPPAMFTFAIAATLVRAAPVLRSPA